ncbi:hypothetical protein [Streptomyces sp. NPDC002156]
MPSRRHEFATVRRCAREALAALGLQPVPILPDRHGAPHWPATLLGSLTHCRRLPCRGHRPHRRPGVPRHRRRTRQAASTGGTGIRRVPLRTAARTATARP